MATPRIIVHHSDNKGRGRGRPKCDHCDRDGHWKSNCYKMHGYPKNKPQYREASNGHPGSSMAVNNAISSSASSELIFSASPVTNALASWIFCHQ